MNSELYEHLSSEFLPFERIFSRKFSHRMKSEASYCQGTGRVLEGGTILNANSNESISLCRRSRHDYACPLC